MGYQTPYRCGPAFGFEIEFTHRGDGIAMHRHTAAHAHSIEVIRGRVMVYGIEGPGARGVLLNVGDRIDTQPEVDHEVMALEPALIRNINHCGMPAEYRGLSDEDFCGETLPPTFPLA